MRRSNVRTFLQALLIVTTSTSTALAQQAPAPAPLVVERIHNGIVVAPDFKVTDVGDETGQLAGVYAGSLVDDKVLIGGAVYWLANGSDTFKLTYGGLLVGWTTPAASRIRFGVRGLAGVGTATLPVSIDAPFIRGPGPSPTIRFGARTSAGFTPDAGLARVVRFGVKDEFVVFEPQGTVGFSVTDHILINVGAGYRAVALTDALRDRVNGPTGSIGLEFDW